jgi:hypothetical protein
MPRMPPRVRRPSEIASCGGCPARWTGILIAHCGSCHVSFGAPTWFDKHRRLDRCLDPIDIRDPEGYQLLREMDGVWRGPELTEAKRVRLQR